MITRSQVARRIGKSIATVRRLEGDKLHPTIGPRNIRLFDEGEVAAVAVSVQRSGCALAPDNRDIPYHEHDNPSWDDYESLQAGLSESEQMVARLEMQLDDVQAKLENLQNQSLAWSQRKAMWRSEIEDGIVMLMRQIDEPDHVTTMIVEALDQLIGEAP